MFTRRLRTRSRRWQLFSRRDRDGALWRRLEMCSDRDHIAVHESDGSQTRTGWTLVKISNYVLIGAGQIVCIGVGWSKLLHKLLTNRTPEISCSLIIVESTAGSQWKFSLSNFWTHNHQGLRFCSNHCQRIWSDGRVKIFTNQLNK